MNIKIISGLLGAVGVAGLSVPGANLVKNVSKDRKQERKIKIEVLVENSNSAELKKELEKCINSSPSSYTLNEEFHCTKELEGDVEEKSKSIKPLLKNVTFEVSFWNDSDWFGIWYSKEKYKLDMESDKFSKQGGAENFSHCIGMTSYILSSNEDYLEIVKKSVYSRNFATATKFVDACLDKKE